MPRNPRRRGRTAKTKTDKTPARSERYRQLRHPFTPQTVFSDDEVHAIHHAALEVLETLGMRILLPEARGYFERAGARVDDDMVFVGQDIVQDALASAPRSIHLRAANPLREQVYENGAMLFMAGSGCPNVSDLERGRRPGDLQGYQDAIRLAQTYDVIHLFGPSVEPQDIPVSERHYAMMQAQMSLGDKPICIYARGRGQVTQSLEMIQIGLNLDQQDFDTGVWAWTVINSNSPRMLDNPMAQGLIDFARLGQMSIITPFCLAGAMAPITVAGALTLQHAEALCGIALTQLVRPGAPISYGGFSSNVDMKSGAPAFGTPEHVKMQLGAGQLARFIGLPWRSAAGSAANLADMQAATETNMSIWGSVLANATLTIHGAGWLEGGLTFGFEKFINDVEALQIIAELAQPTAGSAAEIGLEAIADVAPGGHFFATGHTMERYRDAFYSSIIADLRNFGTWQKDGARSATQRATEIWKADLADFVPPPTGAAVADRLATYIERGKARGGAAPVE